jgi:hypothetical protein
MLMSPIPFWFLATDYRSHSRLIRLLHHCSCYSNGRGDHTNIGWELGEIHTISTENMCAYRQNWGETAFQDLIIIRNYKMKTPALTWFIPTGRTSLPQPHCVTGFTSTLTSWGQARKIKFNFEDDLMTMSTLQQPDCGSNSLATFW